MKCVVFCGGKGIRMDGTASITPKPLLMIKSKPVLEHIMDHYAKYGVTEFILCLGYLGDKIRAYFESHSTPYRIEMIDTGDNSSKAERLLKVKNLLGETFFVTYGDDLSDVDISKVLEFHKSQGKIATLTAIRLPNPYGVLEIHDFEPHIISRFKEKPIMNEWINGGYFVFDKKIFNYIKDKEELEKEVFERLAAEKQIVAFRHPGFWKSMNTLKDHVELNELAEKGDLRIFKNG
jgi:glucose-1-phosphate cytidylyltransferase